MKSRVPLGIQDPRRGFPSRDSQIRPAIADHINVFQLMLIQIIFTPGENESDMEEELRLIVLYLYEVTRQITIQMIPLKILT